MTLWVSRKKIINKKRSAAATYELIRMMMMIALKNSRPSHGENPEFVCFRNVMSSWKLFPNSSRWEWFELSSSVIYCDLFRDWPFQIQFLDI